MPLECSGDQANDSCQGPVEVLPRNAGSAGSAVGESCDVIRMVAVAAGAAVGPDPCIRMKTPTHTVAGSNGGGC